MKLWQIIYELMNKGETNLTKTESKKLGLMVNAAEKFEDEKMGLRPDFKPESLPDMVRLVMLEKKISQARLAEMLKSREAQIVTDPEWQKKA